MQLCITMDVEHDCPPYLTSYRGVEGGLPRFLDLLAEEGVQATCFTTGDVARRFPDRIRRIVDEGHELGCHGDTHRRFGALAPAEAWSEIERASRTLRKFGPVTSFRAPNLDLPASYVPFLRDAGYKLDSSLGRHKMGSYFVAPHLQDGVRRVPASTSPLATRLPAPLRQAMYRRMRSPVVFFFHPWEFVDVSKEPIPIDCKWGTGEAAVTSLRGTIRWFRGQGAELVRMDQLAA